MANSYQTSTSNVNGTIMAYCCRCYTDKPKKTMVKYGQNLVCPSCMERIKKRSSDSSRFKDSNIESFGGEGDVEERKRIEEKKYNAEIRAIKKSFEIL